MPKSFGIPTWRKLQAIDDRLHKVAQAAKQGSASAGQMTLRDLLDEAGFYDRVGGVDLVMQQAEAAADANTSLPPSLTDEFEIFTDTGQKVRDAGYRDFFPAFNYATPNVPVEVFATGDPNIHNDNSYYSNRVYPGKPGTMIQGVSYTALKNNEPPNAVKSGVYLGTPEGGAVTSTTDVRREAANKRQTNPLVQLLEEDVGTDRMDRYVDLGAEALDYYRKGVPPFVVIGHNSLDSTFGDGYTPTLFHEMTHAGLQPEQVALRTEGLLPPKVLDDVLDEMPSYNDPMGMLNAFAVFPRDSIPPLERYGVAHNYYNTAYRTTPIETDAVLADIKRAYADQTGRLVNSPEEAQRALEWYRDHSHYQDPNAEPVSPAMQLHQPVVLPYDLTATRLDADYFLNPEKYSPDQSLGSEAYKRRMMEVLGLGGVGVLAGLMGEGEDENGRVRY